MVTHTFSLHVLGGQPTTSVYSALQFTRSVYKLGHTLRAVFFNAEAVYIALDQASDEFNVAQDWINLSQQYDFKLLLCSTATKHHGVLSNTEAELLNKAPSLRAGFELAGLGELIELSQHSTRFIVF